MSHWDQFTGWEIFPGPKPTESPLRESLPGVTVDADEADWRPLTADGQRDLMPVAQDRMQQMAHYLWESNLLANRLIELPVAYLLAKGVKLRVADEKAQQLLDRHWRHGINAWDIKLPKKVRELGLFGEQCWPVFVGADGAVRVGYLDPSLIETVVTDPDNIEQPIGIVTRRNRKGEVRRYRVIVNEPESEFTARTAEIRATFNSGDCFYYKVNDLCASRRGRSDLLAQIDWLDAYDQFLFGEIDRARFMRAFIWDVTLKGATPDEVAARARKIAAPKPGSCRVHNDSEEWKPQTPELGAYESAAGARLFRNHVLGGATMPPTWYADGEDANRANGQSMAEPTEKMLEMRQRYLGHILLQVGTFVLRAGWGKLDAELSAEQHKVLDTLTVDWPEMTAKDTTKYAAALQQVVVAAVAAINSKLITRELALRLVAAMAAQLGVDFDVEAEMAAVEEAAKSAAAEDVFVPGDTGAAAGA